MAFCTQCGNSVGDTASFCGSCGASQTAQPGPQAAASSVQSESISPRTASILCYVPHVGWLACIFVLAADRFRANDQVRFHAFQGLYLFVAWLLLSGDFGLFRLFHIPFGHWWPMDVRLMIRLAFYGIWIFMMVKAGQNDRFRLPLLGEWAERSLVRN